MKEMRLTRFQFTIFAALILMFMIPQVANAGVNGSSSSPDFSVLQFYEGKVTHISSTEELLTIQVDITPVAYDQNGQARAWYYTEEVEFRFSYDPYTEIDDPFYYSKRLDIRDNNGNYYLASGYLDLVGTVYDFPYKDWKTGIYKGTIGCYIY